MRSELKIWRWCSHGGGVANEEQEAAQKTSFPGGEISEGECPKGKEAEEEAVDMKSEEGISETDG